VTTGRHLPDMSTSTVGLMTLLVWLEGDPPSLRIRITQALDVEQPERVETVTTDPDEATTAVRGWLRDFAVTATTAAHGSGDRPVTGERRE